MTPQELKDFYKDPAASPLWEEQINLEKHMLQLGAEAFRDTLKRNTEKRELANMAPQKRLLQTMVEPVAQAIIKWKENAVTKRGPRPVALPAISALDPYVLALIATRSILDQMVPQKLNLAAVCQEIGLSVEHECKIEEWSKMDPKMFYRIQENQKKDGSTPIHIRRVNINLYNKYAAKSIQWKDWSDRLRLHTGLALVDIIVQTTRAFEVIPDPQASMSSGNGKKRKKSHKPPNVLVPTKETAEWLRDALASAEVMRPHYLPTIAPPRRWTTPRKGGYWSRFVRAPFMIRFKANQQMQKARAIDEFMALDIGGAYQALNRMQEVGWKVNLKVLEVAQELWARGHGEAGLPISKARPLPAKPHDIATNTEARRKWKVEAAKVHAFNSQLFSNSITVTRTLDIARLMANREFFFPHMYDFRGRMYPIPSALQPQGGDLARGLLTFADGKAVDGAEGWIAVQVANTWGHDKVSYADRLKWVEENRELFERIVDDPIGNKEWMMADSPFQALAATFEIVAMWRHGPGYVSSLPIRIDGTCNGLQHLAILSGDKVVAQAVNVLPSEVPADIYQDVADAATSYLKKRLEGGDIETDEACLIRTWLRITNNRLPRSLSKRPVMILPYGGTMQAFGEYTRDWLAENEQPSWGELDTYLLGTYMAKVLWGTVQTRMNGPMRVMKWLKQCAGVAATGGAPLYWITPAGFVVRHFYSKMASSKLFTKLDGRSITMQLWSPTDELSRDDQTRGIAPNFVHSQDASVLIGCVQACRREGVRSITTIHDSFGTVAADMGVMGSVLRECFIVNYSSDVLMDFYEACLSVTPETAKDSLPKPPAREPFDLEAIRQSDYFFA